MERNVVARFNEPNPSFRKETTMSEAIFRGSWIPATKLPNNQRFFCPFCGQMVYMRAGSPTYPTCPWCISDMPEADDFKTPDELHAPKIHAKSYSEPVDITTLSDEEADKEYRRQYYELNSERLLAKYKESSPSEKERRREYTKKYREEHREEIKEKARAARAADPERFKAYALKQKQKSMREVEAHIRGVSPDEIPRNGFYFGKGVERT